MMNNIVNFLNDIGFRIERTLRPRIGFLPGISIEGMTLYVDGNELKHEGDLLHEAGHIAIIPSIFRMHVSGGNIDEAMKPIFSEYFESHDFVKDGVEDPIMRGLLQCDETEAIAWSYAAAIECGIDPSSVLHFDYDNSLKTMLQNNQYFGINGLQAAGMTSVKTFPTMNRWLQL
jgi:hypothetical protein